MAAVAQSGHRFDELRRLGQPAAPSFNQPGFDGNQRNLVQPMVPQQAGEHNPAIVDVELAATGKTVQLRVDPKYQKLPEGQRKRAAIADAITNKQLDPHSRPRGEAHKGEVMHRPEKVAGGIELNVRVANLADAQGVVVHAPSVLAGQANVNNTTFTHAKPTVSARGSNASGAQFKPGAVVDGQEATAGFSMQVATLDGISKTGGMKTPDGRAVMANAGNDNTPFQSYQRRRREDLMFG